MSWLDQKYCGLLSIRLPLYKVKRSNPFLAEFRCPLCGDSATNKNKKRGFIFSEDRVFKFKCHNCGEHHTFSYFLKLLDTELYKEYAIENFKEGQGNTQNSEKKAYYDDNPNNDFKKPVFITDTQLRTIQKISSLKADHPAKMYVSKRLIPNPYHARLFYCRKFFEWVNTIIPEKFDITGPDQERLIIPLLDKQLTLFGFQGRAFDSKTQPKYYTIMLDSTMPKVFGLDTIDFSSRTYIMEGPIDSMFIHNSIAMVGGDLALKNIDINIKNSVFVFDNEPRNPEMVHRTQKMIDSGHKVCIWPNGLEYKDINDMVMAGMQRTEIKLMIDENTYYGLAAMNAIADWRKI
jgi:transcription elongation factor Elf1